MGNTDTQFIEMVATLCTMAGKQDCSLSVGLGCRYVYFWLVYAGLSYIHRIVPGSAFCTFRQEITPPGPHRILAG